MGWFIPLLMGGGGAVMYRDKLKSAWSKTWYADLDGDGKAELDLKGAFHRAVGVVTDGADLARSGADKVVTGIDYTRKGVDAVGDFVSGIPDGNGAGPNTKSGGWLANLFGSTGTTSGEWNLKAPLMVALGGFLLNLMGKFTMGTNMRPGLGLLIAGAAAAWFNAPKLKNALGLEDLMGSSDGLSTKNSGATQENDQKYDSALDATIFVRWCCSCS